VSQEQQRAMQLAHVESTLKQAIVKMQECQEFLRKMGEKKLAQGGTLTQPDLQQVAVVSQKLQHLNAVKDKYGNAYVVPPPRPHHLFLSTARVVDLDDRLGGISGVCTPLLVWLARFCGGLLPIVACQNVKILLRATL
jgi:hypothetical protein